MLKRIYFRIFLLVFTCAFFEAAKAQAPTWTIDLLGKEKKPEKFENRKLGSEKMADKKFTFIRHFFQNNYTHYNYYFNARNKINTVLERAKASQKDDYDKLLTYYPYTLENTASQKSELDSVIYKATAGILLHDLRNDWVDNMYLLMGKAFFFRKEFDSAAATFQFINYNLFPRKKHEDDNRIVGTTDASTNNVISIANKEKLTILQKMTAALPPSRNDALIWMARTLIEQNEWGESGSLLNTLQYDPNLPPRLRNDLDDVNAYWFYRQNIYDSAADYLEKALSNADTKQDLSRSEFLLAQLYERTNRFDKATTYYEKVSTHTVDPIMDIHARLNNAKMLKGTNPEELTNSINNLVRMAKKDRFEAYRDIIFYSAGELAMQKPDSNEAIGLFGKSLRYNESNIIYKNKAFLQLADIAYNRKQFKTAYAFYDSLQSGDTTLKDRLASIQARRNSLAKIVEKIVIIEREDSLQAIAAMPAADRETFIKKMAARLRKEKGLKDEEAGFANNPGMPGIDNKLDNSRRDQAVDLFASSSKGEWYFYNTAAKSNGQNDFKRKWSTRTNVDNWARKSATADAIGTGTPGIGVGAPDDIDKPSDPSKKTGAPDQDLARSPGDKSANSAGQPEDISYEGLMSNLPLTPENLAKSKALVAINIFELAKLFQEDLEDYGQAIVTYDESLSRFPDSLYNGELYLGLYYCYTKLGDAAKAAYYKNLLGKNFAGTHAALILNNPSAANPKEKNPVVTKRYEAIYNSFIEGNFEQAFAEKKKADSLYGNNYWSPQLLYIEAVYHIRQHADSTAIAVLKNITSLYPGAKLTPKAERMIDVLKRRKEIEDYLTKLQITRAKDDEVVKIDERPTLKRNDLNLIKSPVRVIDTSKNKIKRPVTLPPKDTTKPVVEPPAKDTGAAIVQTPVLLPPAKDSIQKAPTVFVNGPFTMNTELPHNVIMILDKVDGTYVNESKNAFNRYLDENYRGDSLILTRDALDQDRSLLLFSSFANASEAYQFLQKIKRAAPDEISWLPANKYSFYLITNENLQLLKTNKDITAYIGLLGKVYPGKF